MKINRKQFQSFTTIKFEMKAWTAFVMKEAWTYNWIKGPGSRKMLHHIELALKQFGQDVLEVELQVREAAKIHLELQNALEEGGICQEDEDAILEIFTLIQDALMDHFSTLSMPKQGIDRCGCGCKYWSWIYCADCEETFSPIDDRSAVDALLGL